MPRVRNESDPDVNSPVVDDDYDSDEKMPIKDGRWEITETDEDDDSIKKPGIGEPYRGPGRAGNIQPIEEPLRKDRETGDIDKSPKQV